MYAYKFGLLHLISYLAIGNCQSESGTPLFLTPLINSGEIDQARSQSKVNNLPLANGVTERDSFSGFITVNEEYNSNLFFWFFPASNNTENSPVILWLDGGPGVSNFMSLFNQNGPYQINDLDNIEDRTTTWVDNHSIIYLESPVGTGYSFTGDKRGYSATSEDAAQNTMVFLRQFFQLFPEFDKNPLHVFGESYGGHFAPPVVTAIHQQNQGGNEPQINLQGMVLLCPWTNPLLQSEYGDYLFQVGLIEDATLTYFHNEEAALKELIIKGDFAGAKDKWAELIMNHDSTLANSTGFLSNMNVLQDQLDYVFYSYAFYVERPDFRLAIHVGNFTYNLVSAEVQEALNEDLMASKAHLVEEILNASEEYQVIVVSGQMDLAVMHTSVERLVANLKWHGAEDYNSANRTVWSVQNTVAGYVKKARNLSYILLRNAGHFLIADQPEWTLDLINRLILRGTGEEFPSSSSTPSSADKKLVQLSIFTYCFIILLMLKVQV